MHYLLIANINLNMKLKTSSKSKYELEEIIYYRFPSVIDFTSKKKTKIWYLNVATFFGYYGFYKLKKKFNIYLLLLILI